MNFTVPIPAAGPTAIVEFGFDDLAKLQEAFGSGYALVVARRLDSHDSAALQTCLDIAGHGGDFAAALRTLPFVELSGAVIRALSLRLMGEGEADESL